jgi:hypothetical protein
MKKTVLNIVVLSLVAFSFFGCATQSNRADVWRDAESLDDYVGKWEGSVVLDIPENIEGAIPKTSLEVTISFEYLQGAARVSGSMKMDLAQFLTDWSNMGAIKSAGLSKDSLWVVLVGEFQKNPDFTVGGEYFVMQDLSGDVGSFFSDESGKIQINGSGNQLKLIFSEALSFGMGDTGFTEIILDKK